MLDLYKDAIEEQFAVQQGINQLIRSLPEFMPQDDILKMLRSKSLNKLVIFLIKKYLVC